MQNISHVLGQMLQLAYRSWDIVISDDCTLLSLVLTSEDEVI